MPKSKTQYFSNSTVYQSIILRQYLKEKDINRIIDLWGNNKKLQKANARLLPRIIELSKENGNNVSLIWNSTIPEVQKANEDILPLIIELLQEDCNNIVNIWNNTAPEVQEGNSEILPRIIELVQKNIDAVVNIWNNTDQKLKKEKLNIFSKILIHNKSEQNIVENRLKELYKKNNNIYKTVILRFLCNYDLIRKFNDEQLLRVTAYPEVQKFILQYKDNPYMQKMIERVCDNTRENNWIISLSKIMKNTRYNCNYRRLLRRLKDSYNQEKISNEYIEKLLSVVSERKNYFNIQSAEDVENFYKIREEKCLKILKGETTKIPQQLSHYSQSNLYKFALLEYKFGIDLKEAKRLVKIYGTDVKELIEQAPEDMKDYAKFLEAIKVTIESDNIVEIVQKNIENIGEPWKGYPSAREAEGKIINIFEYIYNKVLYKPEEHEKDREDDDAVYKDEKGQEHKIPIYNISSDFQINVRVEGAYNNFLEPNNFADYYNKPDINNHGNCESFIRSDKIATAIPNENSVIVGYSHIRKNSLTAVAPYDLGSSNDQFDIYSKDLYRPLYRIPNKMIDTTRTLHNEMVKDRICGVDEEGNIIKSKPDYALWIIEDREEDKRREESSMWIRTKKLAFQLNIPIVVIDREKFAEREQNKVEKMKEIVLSGRNNIEEYEEYFNKEEIERYKGLSQEQLAREILTKIDNKRVELQFNERLKEKYFTDEQRNKIEELINTYKETEQSDTKPKTEITKELLDLYFQSGISPDDLNNVTKRLTDSTNQKEGESSESEKH